MTIDRPAGWIRGTPLAVWAMLVGATAFVLTFNPTDRIADPTGPCLWHAAFGIDGPSCGGTRMFYYLIHGSLVQAARMHLPALIGMLYGAYVLIAWTGSWLLGRTLPVWRPGKWAIVGYVAFFLIFSVVLRNLPWAPFSWFYVPDLTF
jgi:Protein of unknown function (DUF2752)